MALPTNLILDSGIDPVVIPSPQDLFFHDLIEIIIPGFRIRPLVNFSWYLQVHSLLGCTGKLLNLITSSVFLAQVTAHHFYVGIVCIISSLLALAFKLHSSYISLSNVINSWHAQLSINLAIAASLSIVFAHHIYAIPIYPYLASDYPTVLSLFTHHMWLGAFLIIGAGAHASIFIIADKQESNFLLQVLNHRDVILGHLIWVSIALGFHSFSLYIHNDTLQALGRAEDIFDDNSIQLKPVFARWVQSFFSFDIKMVSIKTVKKVIQITQELGTADFIVHHIHAFTIHVALLILSKGILYARCKKF
jgi:photosystem I P700 chlorophyll a apoprotein A1